MKFARVVGNLVASQTVKGLEGVKWLMVQPLNAQRQPDGEIYVAADATAQAGMGELVQSSTPAGADQQHPPSRS